MPLSMPMWPPVFTGIAAKPQLTAPLPPSVLPIRRRWMIVDHAVPREVGHTEYQAALANSKRVEIAHYLNEDVMTHFCYPAASMS